MDTTNCLKLLLELRNAIATTESVETQLELHRLHDILDRARSAGVVQDFAPAVEAALAVAGSKNPNLNIIREIRNRLDLDVLNKRPGLVSWIRQRIGDSPVYAMLVGTTFAFIVGISILMIAVVTWRLLEPYKVVGQLRVKEVVLVVFASVAGACISILSRSIPSPACSSMIRSSFSSIAL